MNKAKAMLDALMGPSRDTTSKPSSDDWKDRRVCKTFLVAVCPYDKTMLGGRKGVEVCPKIHNEMLRESFNKHADGAADSRFRFDCEEKAMRDLSEAIAAKDQWAREQASRKNAMLNIRPGGQNKEIGKMKRQVCELKEKADLIDDTESIANAALKAQLLKEYAEGLEEYEAFVKDEEKKADAAAPRAKTCPVCGTAYEKEDDHKLHLTFTRHTSFVQIHEHYDRLKEKKAELEKKAAEEKAKKAEEKSKRHGDEKGKKHDEEKGKKHDEEKDKNHDEEKGKKHDEEKGKKHDEEKGKKHDEEKDNDKNEKADKSKKQDGNDNDGKNGKSDKKRSRSREKDKTKDKERTGPREIGYTRSQQRSRERRRSKDRDRGRDKDKAKTDERDKDKRKRDRSRSGGGRKRSRSRSRSRRRDRDRRR